MRGMILQILGCSVQHLITGIISLISSAVRAGSITDYLSVTVV